MDRGLNELLKWSLENSNAPNVADQDGANAAAAPQQQSSARDPNLEALNVLLGGPSDAELMQASISVITSTDTSVPLSDKLVAFDNLEQLVEQIDNANNLGSLGLWSPLLGMLDSDEAELRKMAAWCAGTAVQNNVPCQERLLALGGIPRLASLAVKESEDKGVRRKAVYALSSAVRNYQPGMNVLTEELAKTGYGGGEVDASNMDAVDGIISDLRQKATDASA
jgi:hsp70-interacting protein